jgi:hypothetical protein
MFTTSTLLCIVVLTVQVTSIPLLEAQYILDSGLPPESLQLVPRVDTVSTYVKSMLVTPWRLTKCKQGEDKLHTSENTWFLTLLDQKATTMAYH